MYRLETASLDGQHYFSGDQVALLQQESGQQLVAIGYDLVEASGAIFTSTSDPSNSTDGGTAIIMAAAAAANATGEDDPAVIAVTNPSSIVNWHQDHHHQVNIKSHS